MLGGKERGGRCVERHCKSCTANDVELANTISSDDGVSIHDGCGCRRDGLLCHHIFGEHAPLLVVAQDAYGTRSRQDTVQEPVRARPSTGAVHEVPRRRQACPQRQELVRTPDGERAGRGRGAGVVGKCTGRGLEADQALRKPHGLRGQGRRVCERDAVRLGD
jgi:hypothetical protein